MDEMMDKLQDILEERVHDLLEQRNGEEKCMDYKREKANVERADKIMNQLPEEQKKWLDNLLISSAMLAEVDARKMYMAGVQDAIKMMKLLGF